MALSKSKRRGGRRGGRSGRRGNNNRLVKVLAAILMLVSILGLGGYGLNEYTKIERIAANYCYAREDQAQTAVFLDYSINRNMSPAQRRDLSAALERAYDALPTNGRIMVFTTARDTAGSIARPIFEMCRPAGDAAQQASIGAPSKPAPNLRRIAGDARDAFRGRVAGILSDTTNDGKSALESPILANVQAISRYPGFQGRTRAFVWFSDGIENSETAKFCAVKGDMPSAETFVQRPAYAAVEPDAFNGVDVTLLLLESLALPQAGLEFCTHGEMQVFWRDLFRINGAASVRLERLRRVNGS